MNKLILLVDKFINFLFTITFILVMAFGVYAIYDMIQVKDSANLSDEILNLKPKDDDLNYSIDQLQEINSDIVGWLRINNTNIDYPIVIGKDNNEYLNKNYKKEFSTAGSIFLDYRNDRTMSDDYSVVYGHNMNKDLMFSDVKNFSNADYFNSHEDGLLYLKDGLYKIEIYAYANVNASEDMIYNIPVIKTGQKAAIINFINKNAAFKRDFNFSNTDKLILLSTCDNNRANQRDVLLGKYYKIDQSANIVKKEDSQENQTIKKESNFNLNLSFRDIAFIILTLIVAVIFIILIKMNVSKRKKVS